MKPLIRKAEDSADLLRTWLHGEPELAVRPGDGVHAGPGLHDHRHHHDLGIFCGYGGMIGWVEEYSVDVAWRDWSLGDWTIPSTSLDAIGRWVKERSVARAQVLG
eukprot:1036791-Pyramimonas_sp.AAC.1